MTGFYLLASVPSTSEWGPATAIIMIACNILAIAIGKLTIRNLSATPALPYPKFFGGMGYPALLATTSVGHILGFGTIIGLANMGVL